MLKYGPALPLRQQHTGAASHRVIIFLLRSKYSSHYELAVLKINNNNLRFVRQKKKKKVKIFIFYVCSALFRIVVVQFLSCV